MKGVSPKIPNKQTRISIKQGRPTYHTLAPLQVMPYQVDVPVVHGSTGGTLLQPALLAQCGPPVALYKLSSADKTTCKSVSVPTGTATPASSLSSRCGFITAAIDTLYNAMAMMARTAHLAAMKPAW
jgi:hypothetical protein